MAKYVINENSDLHSLAKEVQEIATRRETAAPDTVADEVTAKATTASRPGTRAANPTKRALLMGVGLGAGVVIIALGVLFGMGKFFTPGMCTVPNVVDKRVDTARSTLEAGGFQVVVEYESSTDCPAGTVIAQVPPAKVKKPAGSQVLMRVAGNPPARGKQATKKTGAFELGRPAAEKKTEAAEKETKTAPPDPALKEIEPDEKDAASTDVAVAKLTVPAVEGMNIDEARKVLGDMGLKIVEASAHEAGKPDGEVVDIDPKAGVEIQAGALVRIRINSLSDKDARPGGETPRESAGPEASRIILRDYTGKRGDEAVTDMYSRGLSPEWKYEISNSHIPGTVIVTDPPAGSRIPPGSKVFMVLSR